MNNQTSTIRVSSRQFKSIISATIKTLVSKLTSNEHISNSALDCFNNDYIDNVTGRIITVIGKGKDHLFTEDDILESRFITLRTLLNDCVSRRYLVTFKASEFECNEGTTLINKMQNSFTQNERASRPELIDKAIDAINSQSNNDLLINLLAHIPSDVILDALDKKI